MEASPLTHRILALLTLVFAAAALASAAEDPELSLQVREGFRVEQVYAVPRATQGSWVALTVDDRGRLIASDQTGSLYRITVGDDVPVAVERVDLPIGHAHGLLYAFSSLYVVVAEDAYQGPGLYRIRDTDGDDRFDQVALLQTFQGTGEHGPHSVILSPDGQSLLVVAGNKTAVPAPALRHSLVPTNWSDDDLLPRLWGPIGSESGTPAPGGWVARTDPAGSQWQLLAVGLRNGFDLVFHGDGDLFTVDADAEFDLGTPWYQPTRVFHVIPGTDYGWRSGSGKRPPYHADTLPPVTELGSGSPTGIVSGHGTCFPAHYQSSLFVGDWSRGRLLAVRITPDGSSYSGAAEAIVTGTPLPVTDLVVHPREGSIYFAVGGRGVASGLYRLSWVGPENDQQRAIDVAGESEAAGLRAVRRRLASHLAGDDPVAAIEAAWPHLSHSDRAIRHTARIVLEHVPPRYWQSRALADDHPLRRLTALLALARSHDGSLPPEILASLTDLPWDGLSHSARLLWLRVADASLTRMTSEPIDEDRRRRRFRKYLEAVFPTGRHDVDGELCRLLVFLQSAEVPAVAMELIDAAVTQQQRLVYAVPLRHQRAGWTPELRRRYFSLLADASHWRGGVSLSKYIERIAEDAVGHVPEQDRAGMAELLRQNKVSRPPVASRAFVRKWTVGELTGGTGQHSDGDPVSGRRLFAALRCFDCHRFQGEGGGVGPDLTSVARRLNRRDLLEAIITPDEVISDQFASSTILTVSGKIVTGRVVNLRSDALMVQTDMLQPAELQRIPRDEIEMIQPAKTSMMPSGLLDTCSGEDIADLVAFLQQTTNTAGADER